MYLYKKYTWWDIIVCMSIENMLIMCCDLGYNHEEKENVDKYFDMKNISWHM